VFSVFFLWVRDSLIESSQPQLELTSDSSDPGERWPSNPFCLRIYPSKNLLFSGHSPSSLGRTPESVLPDQSIFGGPFSGQGAQAGANEAPFEPPLRRSPAFLFGLGVLFRGIFRRFPPPYNGYLLRGVLLIVTLEAFRSTVLFPTKLTFPEAIQLTFLFRGL